MKIMRLIFKFILTIAIFIKNKIVLPSNIKNYHPRMLKRDSLVLIIFILCFYIEFTSFYPSGTLMEWITFLTLIFSGWSLGYCQDYEERQEIREIVEFIKEYYEEQDTAGDINLIPPMFNTGINNLIELIVAITYFIMFILVKQPVNYIIYLTIIYILWNPFYKDSKASKNNQEVNHKNKGQEENHKETNDKPLK